MQTGLDNRILIRSTFFQGPAIHVITVIRDAHEEERSLKKDEKQNEIPFATTTITATSSDELQGKKANPRKVFKSRNKQ